MKIETANRINTVNEYYFSKKLEEIAQLSSKEFPVINLGIGSPDLAPDNKVVDTLISSAKTTTNHGYQNYKGSIALRKAISNWYKLTYNVTADSNTEILPLIGSKEGIMHISMTYINEGDEVLIPNPGYPTYSAATKLAGGNIKQYNLTDQNNWDINLEEIKKLITAKTKLIWVNFPHMPTGTAGNKDTLIELIELAKAYSILIVNDNPYSLTLNKNPISLLSLDETKEVVIELNSLSKSHSMAGWRIGMMLGHQDRINEVLKFKSNMDSGMFLPLQEAAVTALSLDENWHKETNQIYAKRRVKAYELLDLLNCSYNHNQIGMFVWAKVPSTLKNGEHVSDFILNKAKVFITPGFIFGSNGEQFIRVSLCKNIEEFDEAILRIKKLQL